jgi:hypothetical protein
MATYENRGGELQLHGSMQREPNNRVREAECEIWAEADVGADTDEARGAGWTTLC